MKSLRNELVAKIAIITVTICVVFTAAQLILLKQTANNGMDTSVVAAANAYSDSIQNALQIYKTKIEHLAATTKIAPELTYEEILAMCSENEKEYGFLDVSYADSSGKPYDSDVIDISQRDYFRSAITGKTYISSPLVSKRVEANSAIVLYLAAKVNNGSGYDGIVFAEFSNDVFSQMIQDVISVKKGTALS